MLHTLKQRLSLGLRFLALLILSSAGCGDIAAQIGSLPTATPLPQPQVIAIAISPAARPIWGKMQNCAANIPNIAALLTEVSEYAPDFSTADIRVQLGINTQEPAFPYQIGETGLQVIVHPSNPVTALTADELNAIFHGRLTKWAEVPSAILNTAAENLSKGQIEIWTLQPCEVSRHFELEALGGKAVSSTARLAPDPAAMLQAIASDPAAIGYLPNIWLTDDVKVITLDINLMERLSMPILAITSREPEGALRLYLACLQTK